MRRSASRGAGFADSVPPVDVLLEEELAAAARPRSINRTAVRALPFAALMLLGVAIVVAVASRWPEVAPTRTPQDPAPVRVRVPFAKALLPQVVAIELRESRLEFVAPGLRTPLGQYAIHDPAQVATWRNALADAGPGALGASTAGAFVALVLADGREAIGFFDGAALDFRGQRLTLRLDLPTAAAALAEEQLEGRRRRGEAFTRAELATLPAESRRITAPWLTGQEARESLGRFVDVQALEFAPGATILPRSGDFEMRLLTGNDLVAAVAELATLQHLTMRAGWLQREGLQALAAMPQLRSLAITGDPSELPAAELGQLASRLHTLRFVDGLVTRAQMDAVSRSKTLRELWVAWRHDDVGCADALLRLSALTRLSLGVPFSGERAGVALTRIAATRVAELRLRWLRVEDRELAALAGLATLRVLELENVVTASGTAPDATPLRQLRRLRGHDPAQQESLAEALPECRLSGANDLEWPAPFWPRLPPD